MRAPGLALIASLAYTSFSAPVPASDRAVPVVTGIAPDDAGLSYTEYVHLTVTPQRARFSRPTVDEFGTDMAPGARINFRTDALRVALGLEFLTTGLAGSVPRLEIDGWLVDTDIGDGMQGAHWDVIFQQSAPVPHDFSVLLPYDAPTDFLGLRLTDGSGALFSPPTRPAQLYVAYGDSVTHGFAASDVTATYPHLVGLFNGWKVINMGFGGRRVTGRDGLAVGDLSPDFVSIEIGVNDFNESTPLAHFRLEYEDFLNKLRWLAPTAAVTVVTPTWTHVEHERNTLSLTLENYREAIREVVDGYADTDPFLSLVEGRDVASAGFTFFPDGVHPNDAANLLIARAIVFQNFVREGNFEMGGSLWNSSGEVEPVESDSERGFALATGPRYGFSSQRLYGLQPGDSYQLQAKSRMTQPQSEGSYGVVFFDALGNWLASRTMRVNWTVNNVAVLTVDVPAGADRAEAWIWKVRGPGVLLVDDVILEKL